MTPQRRQTFRRSWAYWAVAGLFVGMLVSVFDARETLWVDAGPPPLFEAKFELKRHDGKSFSSADLEGRFSLVYFGYTHCPDVCPIGLFALASMLKSLEASGRDVLPLFVTLDPARDTQEVMGAYVAAFHPGIVGVTGPAEQVDRIATAMDVRYEVEEGKEHYLVSHSAFTYLVSPEGEVLRSFPDGVNVEYAVGVIEREIPVVPRS